MSNNEILRHIPKVDDLLSNPRLEKHRQTVAYATLLESVREVIDSFRADVLKGNITSLPEIDFFVDKAIKLSKSKSKPDLIPVINATGIVLHTNLGRANLSEKVADHVKEIAMGYSTLEYNKDEGRRGSRYDHVESIILKLTGAEAALIVNNNAAAILLALSALAKDKEVVVSRGEIVEIGGSFRVSEIMEQGGAILKEVGTTNKTHRKDYENALTENTGALLKVHTSNFKTIGFTESVPVSELVDIVKDKDIPVIHDLGSGIMVDLADIGIYDEPNVLQCFAEKPDVLCFSGDKLLGGPQAGIIIGKKKYIETMKAHPLTRAFRIDKMTLAALEATFRIYLDMENAKKEIPTLAMLYITQDELLEKANVLRNMILKSNTNDKLDVIIEDTQGQVGGGSVPGHLIDSKAVSIKPNSISVDTLEQAMRGSEIPVIGRIYKDRYMLDVRTIEPHYFEYIVQTLEDICK